jgi:hypothetical protein
MSRLNRENIDRRTNKPNPSRTEGITPDQTLNRAYQTRRDDDVIKGPQRTVYDVDFAIKSYIETEIQPQVTDNDVLINVPVIFANGEKWDNVRRLGFLRDEKGKLQSPLIMIKRNSVAERDNVKGLDVNRNPTANLRAYKQRYNQRNRYEDELFPIPNTQPLESNLIYIVDIPRYVTIEYELLLWCDFTTQMNELIDQILPYNRFAWGNDGNRFTTTMGNISFETVNTVGEDRLVRATIPLTTVAALLSEQETRQSTLRTMFSVKKVTFDTVVDVDGDLYSLAVSNKLKQAAPMVTNGRKIYAQAAGGVQQIDADLLTYLTTITDQQATVVDIQTVTVNAQSANNPITGLPATKAEFDVFINGSYIDKPVYTWTPSFSGLQTIIFDTTASGLDYELEPSFIIIVKGRWA